MEKEEINLKQIEELKNSLYGWLGWKGYSGVKISFDVIEDGDVEMYMEFKEEIIDIDKEIFEAINDILEGYDWSVFGNGDEPYLTIKLVERKKQYTSLERLKEND